MTTGTYTTAPAAEEALTAALADADNPVAAAKALRAVAGRFRPGYVMSWERFRRAAEKALEPILKAGAKPAVWALLADDFGRLDGAGDRDHDLHVHGADHRGPLYRTLREILSDPDALTPPEPVADRLAWCGRVTLLAAREKTGKSTFASAAAAAVSAGHLFLGTSTRRGPVLYLALEDHPSDTVARLVDFRTDEDRLLLVDRLSDPFSDLEAAVADVDPVLVVIDTLAAFTESFALKPGSSSAWTPVMARLARLARDSDAAVLLLHHGRKSDGTYRDSTAIAAGVDVLLEMQEAEGNIRGLKVKGRWPMGAFSVMLTGDPDEATDPWQYELSSGELSMDLRCYAFIESNAGCSTAAVRTNVTGRDREIIATLAQLEGQDRIENRGSATARAWHTTTEPVPGRERVGTAGRSGVSPLGTTAERVGNSSGYDTRSQISSLGTPLRERVGELTSEVDVNADLSRALKGADDYTPAEKGLAAVCPTCGGGMAADAERCETCRSVTAELSPR